VRQGGLFHRFSQGGWALAASPAAMRAEANISEQSVKLFV